MTKDDIYELIDAFIKETWKFPIRNESLDDDIEYIYKIEEDLETAGDSNIKALYDNLIVDIGIIRFKYGYENILINSNPDLVELKNLINNLSLSDNDLMDKYNKIMLIYTNYFKSIKDIDFLLNKYKDRIGKEGLNLAIESFKSLISNSDYRSFLSNDQVREVVIDSIKLNENERFIKIFEKKYRCIFQKIWSNSLNNNVGDKFKILFSNIMGDFNQQAENLINRKDQSSCSLITSEFIATYGSNYRRIGYIYSNNSEIITASCYDLGSNVFGRGTVNSEKGTIIVTPDILEKFGKERAIKKGEDLYSSSCYNEVLVNSKPCGILIIGLGEENLNVDYEKVLELSKKLNLPLYTVDTLKYKKDLSDNDKEYIAFHSVLSYLGMSYEEYAMLCRDYVNSGEFYNLINCKKEIISQEFMKLKESGNLSKENMINIMHTIIDNYKFNAEQSEYSR